MNPTDSRTLRSTYPNGRYRPITKAQFAEFKKRVFAIMAETGAKGESYEYFPATIWRFSSPLFGPYHVILPDEQDVIWSIYTRFEGDLTAVKARWGRGSYAGDPNTCSGKWNVHSSVADAALEDLRYQLEIVRVLSVTIPA